MKKGILLLLLLLPLLGYAEQEIVLLYPSGKEVKADLAAIGKLAFSSDSVFLVSTTGERLGQEAKGKIQHIRFTAQDISTIDETSTTGISIYPNPVTSTLIISGIEHPTTARIYSTNGLLLQATALWEGTNNVSVDGLSEGTYLLQINTEVVRFIRR